MKALIIMMMIFTLSLVGVGVYSINATSTSDINRVDGAFFTADNNTMYYNRYEIYKTVDGEKVLSVSNYESGSFDLYDGVVTIKRGISQEIYLISTKVYDEYEQIHTFYAENGAVITLDVTDRTLTVDKNGNGVIFRINSTIKSNW